MRTHRGFDSLAAATVALTLLLLLALALAACGGSDTSAQAPTDLPTRTAPVAAYTFSPPTNLHSDFAAEFMDDTDGLEFVPWVDIDVTALGYYDYEGDGLAETHRVGIFETETKKAIASVLVTSESTLQDGFRYEAMGPLTLKAGTSYILASDTGHDLSADHPPGLEWAPEIDFVVDRAARTGNFAYPDEKAPAHLWAAMNFLFMPVSAASPTP